jgi:hypothetical protein
MTLPGVAPPCMPGTDQTSVMVSVPDPREFGKDPDHIIRFQKLWIRFRLFFGQVTIRTCFNIKLWYTNFFKCP